MVITCSVLTLGASAAATPAAVGTGGVSAAAAATGRSAAAVVGSGAVAVAGDGAAEVAGDGAAAAGHGAAGAAGGDAGLGAVAAEPAGASAAARGGAGPPGGGVVARDAFGWPLAGFPPVLRRFDPPEHRYGPGHRGVDLGGWDGQPVLAAGAGVVAFAGPVAGKPVVSVDHPNGLRTTYEPVVAAVAPGDHVARGQPIGVLQAGHDGCTAAACLHWGVRRGQEYLDPLWLLAAGRVRLLPINGG